MRVPTGEAVGARFNAAIEQIDAANAADPRRESADGESHPVELLYARRLTYWVERLAPDGSEELRVAARALHIRRWLIPRDDYPTTRTAYHEWRDALRVLHAEHASEILAHVGYDEPTISRVRELIRRTTFPQDPESRIIEDAATLLFLEYQLDELAAKTEHATMLRLLRRAWRKLTPRGRALVLCLQLSEASTALCLEAISG